MHIHKEREIDAIQMNMKKLDNCFQIRTMLSMISTDTGETIAIKTSNNIITIVNADDIRALMQEVEDAKKS